VFAIFPYNLHISSAIKFTRFVEVTEWSEKPSVKVAVTVDAPKVIELVMARLVNS